MFKQLHVNITLADASFLMPKYQKMLKAILSNKEKLQELANTPLNENCSAVILKKLPKKLRDPGKFLIPCGFSELKCKAIANLGASINLMPLSVWKKLGLPELISTRMTLELASCAICTPAGIARDVFVPVGKFTFLADFVIVDYESDPRVPLILGRPFLRTARALIDVYGEEMILRDGDEKLILNMRHDTSSYSNQTQRESINLINVFNNLSEDFLKDLFLNQPSDNPTFSSHPELTSPKVNIFDSEGGNVLSEKLLDLDSTKDLHPPLHDDTLSGSTTFSSNPLLEEFADELAFLPKYDDDLQCDIESDLKEIEFMLYQNIDSSLKDSIDHHADHVVNSVPEMFTDKHALDYSSPPIFDEYDDDFLEIESDAKNVYDDPFDSKGEKIKKSKLLIDELDLPCDFLLFEYDSFISQEFSRVNALASANNENKIFNPGILIQERSFEIITRVVQDKKLATSNASSMLEDFDPPFYEPFFFKEVSSSKIIPENEKTRIEGFYPSSLHFLGFIRESVGSLLAKNLGILCKWKWIFLSEDKALWWMDIKDFYGDDWGFSLESKSFGSSGLWTDIIKAVNSVNTNDEDFKYSFIRNISNAFPRLYALETSKDCSISDRWHMDNDSGVGIWSWNRPRRGRANDDLASRISRIGTLQLNRDGADKWTWSLDASGSFRVKFLSKRIQNLHLAEFIIDYHHL
nr:reverse transcriptase domain-containing protein [Tanacetum cinerariifolium]